MFWFRWHTVMEFRQYSSGSGVAMDSSMVDFIYSDATFSFVQCTTPTLYSLECYVIYHFHIVGEHCCAAPWLFTCSQTSVKYDWAPLCSELADAFEKHREFWSTPNNKLSIAFQKANLKRITNFPKPFLPVF